MHSLLTDNLIPFYVNFEERKSYISHIEGAGFLTTFTFSQFKYFILHILSMPLKAVIDNLKITFLVQFLNFFHTEKEC